MTNPTGRQTPMTPGEFPAAWHAVLRMSVGDMRAIDCLEKEGRAKAVAARFRRFLACLRDNPAHRSSQLAHAPGRQVRVSVRRSLIGYLVVVEVRALVELGLPGIVKDTL